VFAKLQIKSLDSLSPVCF